MIFPIYLFTSTHFYIRSLCIAKLPKFFSLFWNIRDYSLCYKLHYALEYWREMALWRFVVMKRTQFGSRIGSRWLWNRQHFRFRRFFGPHSWEQEEDWKSNCLNSHCLLIPNIFHNNFFTVLF